MESNENTIGMN